MSRLQSVRYSILMTPFPAFLVLISTVAHAGWNLLAKGQPRKAVFFNRMIRTIAIAGALPALLWQLRSSQLGWMTFGCAVLSGVFCGFYYLFLMLGYSVSDFSVVYPVARALPVLLLGLADVLRRRPPSTGGWCGMALVTAGCVLAPQAALRGMSWRAYRGQAVVFMVCTAFGTVGYTLVDKIAAERLVAAGASAAALYGYVFFTVSWAVYAAACRVWRLGGERAPVRNGKWRWVLLGAALNFGAYWLILWAYQLCRRASYIVAFRQFSIVIGVVAAFVLYREPSVRVRAFAAALITAGLVLVGVSG
ncbi:MAG: hypothetical protein GXP31_12260 [Kiritimatiellaeota bacterium]|nr:hypothetical protein [Kiritimatiellota bacterium]